MPDRGARLCTPRCRVGAWGHINVFCRPGSLQEGKTAIDPAAFITLISSMVPVPGEILIALRVSLRGRFPNAITYLAAFAAQPGWRIANIALLDMSASALAHSGGLSVGARIVSVPATGSTSSNASAAVIRGAWGWV